MSFGFIQLFFFISLGIVLGLVLLMCYYLKNKIDILEKQSMSFRDILSSLIREIKTHFHEHEKIKHIDRHIYPVKEDEEEEEEEEYDGEGEEEEEGEKIIFMDNADFKNSITIHLDGEEVEGEEVEGEKVQKEGEGEGEEEYEYSVVQDLEEIVPELAEEVEEEVKVEVEEEVKVEEVPDISDLAGFKKMNLNQLKQYALAHNLATYVHKMKKDELLKLIEEKLNVL